MDRRRSREDDNEYKEKRSKKQRVYRFEEIDDENLISLINNIDAKHLSLESNIYGLASYFEPYLNVYKRRIINILFECAIKFPTKCTLYCTLVGLLNAKSSAVGRELVKHMQCMFNDALKSCKWEEVQHILRFLGNLCNCYVVSPVAFLNLLHKMIGEVNNINVPKVRQDWFVYCVLTTLPWVGETLQEKLETELERLLHLIEIFIKSRTKKNHHILRVWTTNTPHPQEEYLDCLWSQVCNLRDENWHEKCIVRPYLAFNSMLCESNTGYPLSSIVLAPHNDTYKYPMPSIVFRMFDNSDCPEGPTLPDSHSIERFLIEDDLHVILNWNKLDRKKCVHALLDLPYKNKFWLEYCIVEVIFAQVFHLPTLQCLEIAYSSILIEFCKFRPLTMPKILRQTANLLFMRIDTMKVICVDRFINWFSYYLSNFHYQWDWKNWNNYLDLDVEHPKLRFIREVVGKCMRLSYHERVRKMLPKSFARFIPSEPESDYKYTNSEAAFLPGTSAAQELVRSIRESSKSYEIFEILDGIPNPQLDEVYSDYNPLLIDVFVQTLLHEGKKSFSHSIAKITRYLEVFKTLSKSEDAQICILQNVFSLWHNNQQMMTFIIDKLLKFKIVECSAIVNWIFSNKMKSELTKMYLWEILHSTIGTMNRYLANLRRELYEAIDKYYSEEEIEEIQENFEVLEDDYKNLFLITFQGFTMILSDHLVECDKNECDYNTHWYKLIAGRLEQLIWEHHVDVRKFGSRIGALIFTENLDSRILDIYYQFINIL